MGKRELIIAAVAACLSVSCEEADMERDASAGRIGASGFYSLARDDSGVWWFEDPEGDPMVSIGINHIEPVLICSEHNRDAFAEKYGDDLCEGETMNQINNGLAASAWARDAREQVRGWGFNTLGVHNPVRQDEMPYVAKFRPFPIDGWAKYDRRFPDPFDPDTREIVEARAEVWCEMNADDPNILGVSFNDMTLWRSGPLRIHEWVRAMMELPAGSPGKLKWLEVVRRNHGDPALAAAAYGVQAEEWEELEERTAWPVPVFKWKVYADVNDMLPLLADAWYGMESEAVRRCDPNHLVFGDKFEGAFDLPSWLYPIIGRHFDLAYIQWYATAERQEHKLAEIHAATGKPVLMGDSSFSHPNEDLPRPKGVHMRSREEVGDAYASYLKSMMETPYVVGWHLCGYIDGSPDLAKYHPYIAIQAGIVRRDGTPYEDTVTKVKAANSSADGWHREAGAKTPKGSWAHEIRKGKRCAYKARRGFSVSQVDNNVFVVGRVAIGTGGVPNKNIGWVVTDEGVVVIDTGFERSAMFTKQVMRQITDKPVKYIIYTHHHGTQVAGAAQLKEQGTKIIAHEQLVREFDLARDMYQFNRRRDSIQFNLPTVTDAPPPEPIYPDITYADTYAFELGGTRFELFHVEGEAPDYTFIWMPDQKIAWVGDMGGGALPLVASPMKRVRDEVKWKEAMELLKKLDPDVVIASVGGPICKKKAIHAVLDSTIEYLTFLHDSVVREMNAGSSLEETLENTAMPPEMANSRLLREVYGSHRFNVEGLYHRYSGWFDQNGTHLRPAPTERRGRAFVETMGGGAKILDRAYALKDEDDLPLALEYCEVLIDAGGEEESAARRLKSELLFRMAGRQTHHMTASMYEKLGAVEYQNAQ